MKQLTVFCSRDLEERVIRALDRAGLEGYLRVAEATGNRFQPPGEIPRSVTWEATLFMVPGGPPERIDAAVEELRAYAGACEIEPCLRLVVSPVERVL